MIGALIDFALRNRLLVPGASIVLFIWARSDDVLPPAEAAFAAE